MAAPERFAETSDSSCTAGAVHTWPFATFRGDATFGRFRSEADIERFSVCTKPVAFDPSRT